MEGLQSFPRIPTMSCQPVERQWGGLGSRNLSQEKTRSKQKHSNPTCHAELSYLILPAGCDVLQQAGFPAIFVHHPIQGILQATLISTLGNRHAQRLLSGPVRAFAYLSIQ